MSWFDSLPAAEAPVPCGTGTHAVRWEAGRLTLPAHPDAEAEMVLGALGGDKPACVTLAESWARHADDLAVLTAGPRSAADRVSVDWAEVAELRAHLPGGQPLATPGTRVARAIRFTASGGIHPAGAPAGPPVVRPGRPAQPRPATPLPSPGMAEMLRRQLRQVELLELLALGPEFQFRLAGTVTASWAGPDRAGDRAGRRPEFSGVLTGRFAPAAQEWLGIDPDAVTVSPHEGPGWGTLEVIGTGRTRRLRASLPVGWLAGVWACGLAVVGGHLVVAVEEPGYPRARVLALAAPDAGPVPLDVSATGGSAGGLAAWTL
jgi:hypothetical protein